MVFLRCASKSTGSHRFGLGLLEPAFFNVAILGEMEFCAKRKTSIFCRLGHPFYSSDDLMTGRKKFRANIFFLTEIYPLDNVRMVLSFDQSLMGYHDQRRWTYV